MVAHRCSSPVHHAALGRVQQLASHGWDTPLFGGGGKIGKPGILNEELASSFSGHADVEIGQADIVEAHATFSHNARESELSDRSISEHHFTGWIDEQAGPAARELDTLDVGNPQDCHAPSGFEKRAKAIAVDASNNDRRQPLDSMAPLMPAQRPEA